MLYKLNKEKNKDKYTKVKRVTLAEIGWKEKDLERLISANIFDFISSNDLMTLFTERPRQEEPYILALDKNGELYVFELKRWSGKQENLLQVLRYGQLFGNSTYEDLNSLFHKEHKTEQELSAYHASYFFGDCEKKIPEKQFNNKQHFIVVTNGLDQPTVEAIVYWKRMGISISAIVYWVFEVFEEYYIEFNTYSQIEDYLEYENNYYVVNTDYSNCIEHHKAMLEEHKAAAYNDGWKEKIKKIQKGDTVFLYQSGIGIVAYGNADGVLKKADEGEKIEYEYYMHLTDFKIMKKPISAAEMKEIAQCGFNFRQTMFAISEAAAQKLLENIDSIKS